MFVQKIGHSSIGCFNGDSVLVCMIYSTFIVINLHPSYFFISPKCYVVSTFCRKVDDNSYIRFLSLLCHTLQDKGSLSSEWKQMKGR